MVEVTELNASAETVRQTAWATAASTIVNDINVVRGPDAADAEVARPLSYFLNPAVYS